MTISRAAMPLLLLSLISIPAIGDDIHCLSEFGDVTLDDDVVIAAPCTLNGTTVEGKITIFAGGSLTAIDATIDGDIKARDADFINLQNSDVDGDVDLRKLVGDVSYVRNNIIDGKIVLKKNRSRLEIRNNYIEKKLDADENNGGVIISENVIDDDLECKKNSPEPNGGNNQVSGKREGQCKNLEAVELPPETEEEPPAESEEDPPRGPEEEPPAESGPPSATSGDTTPPGFELNTGTGGGGAFGSLLVALLFYVYANRSRRSRAIRA